MKSLLEETRILYFIGLFRDGLWSGGELRPPSSPRSAEEKQRTRDEANRKLSSLVPGLFSAGPINSAKLINDDYKIWLRM